MRAFVHWLFEEGLIETNIADRVKAPKRPQLVKQPFTEEELRVLPAAAKANKRTGLRDYSMLLFSLDTGV